MVCQSLACLGVTGIVVRAGLDGLPQTLVTVFSSGSRIHQLFGDNDTVPFSIGLPLELTDGATQQPYAPSFSFHSPTYEPISNCVYWVEGHAIMRLDSSNAVTLVAGRKADSGDQDGAGSTARFTFLYPDASVLAVDGRGSLFVASRQSVYKVALNGAAAQVTTYWQMPSATPIYALAFDTMASVLLGASTSEVYRLPVGTDGVVQVNVVAGSDKASANPSGGLAADRLGRVYFADYGGSSLWRLNVSSGEVDRLHQVIPFTSHHPTILPQGCLASCARDVLTFFYFSERLEAATGPSVPRTDNGNFVELLGGTVVCILVEGQRRFTVHRQLLTQCSDYFRQRLEGSFAESGAAEIELPDVDAEAFGCLLQALYASAMHVQPRQFDIPAPLLRPVAELAGRLLVRDVSLEVQRRLPATVSPATIAADLVWAERHNLTATLLPQLKDYFLRRSKEAVEAAPESAQTLMEGSPALAAELFTSLAARGL